MMTQETTVLAYCSTCKQTLKLWLRPSNPEASFTGHLLKITYIHKGSRGEAVHALVIHLDPNFSVRRAEVTDMIIANSPPQDEKFFVTAFCQQCQHDLNIPLHTQRFKQVINTRGFYNQIFIHGHENQPHALIILIDSQKQVIRAEITDLLFHHSFETSKLFPQEVSREKYTLIDSRKFPSNLFKGLFIFDRRSKTVIEFYEEEEFPIDEIAVIMEQKIDPLEREGQPAFMLSVFQDGNEYVFFMFNYQVVIMGIDFNKAYIAWLQTLVQTLQHEAETPNTLGVEIFLKLMERDYTTIKMRDVKLWSNILYSPLYSIHFSLRNQRANRRILLQIDKLFPNVGLLFRLCVDGKRSILEVLNTETGLQNFDEFLDLIAYLEQKKLF
ncbi:MAG: hypothetical protein ACFFC7_32410 [Candidatus Hermodarchaeota archaeon]